MFVGGKMQPYLKYLRLITNNLAIRFLLVPSISPKLQLLSNRCKIWRKKFYCCQEKGVKRNPDQKKHSTL